MATPAAEEAASLRTNFVWFAIQFAVNHGVVTTPLVISTSVLENQDIGYVGNALINVFTVTSAFFLAAPMVGLLGLKGALLFGMLFYCLYAALFTAAVASGSAAAQWGLFCTGSSFGGIAAGVLWTAQGGYFARSVDLILAQEPGSSRPQLSAQLASTFAFLYLGFEVAAKLLWSGLDWYLSKHFSSATGYQSKIAALYTVVGTVALLLMTRARSLDILEPPAHWSSKIKAAVSIWSDPNIFLLSGMNFTFGFSAAFMNGYVNGNYAKALGSYAPAMLAAVTVLTAAVLSRALGPLAARVGKGSVVVLGAVCFLCIPLSLLLLGCCRGWDWWLVVLYLLQGTGRAVYESTNKGVFADFFPNPAQSVGAFANVMLQSSSAFALCFFLSEKLQGRTLAWIVAALAVFTPLGFWGAAQRRARRQHLEGRFRPAQPLLQPRDAEAPGEARPAK